MELQKLLLMCSDCFWYVDFQLKTFQPHKNMLNPLRTLWKKNTHYQMELQRRLTIQRLLGCCYAVAQVF